MNRRHLAFLVLVNALVSLVVALGVVWAFEARRPDPEALAAVNTPIAAPQLAVVAAPPTATPAPGAAPVGEPTFPVPSPTPNTTLTGDEDVYIVQPGDTLLVIATRYNLTVDQLLQANNLTNPDYVFSGQRLVIPGSGGGSQTAATPATNLAPDEGVLINRVVGVGNIEEELVEIVNESNAAFSLQGWRLEREGGPAFSFGNVSLFPGGSVRLRSVAGADTTLDLFWDQAQPVWSSGAVVRLLDAQGQEVSRYTVP